MDGFVPARRGLRLWSGPVSVETLFWSAEQVVRMHSEAPSEDRATGSCAQCLPGGGCELLRKALDVVASARPPVVLRRLAVSG